MTLPANATPLPSVQAQDFDGPLDLLLAEVRRQNVSIEKISMAPIVGRFLEYVRTAAERNLNLDIEWLHMAATLIHWKSCSLLPADVTVEPAADPIRDSLVQQLLAYRKQAAGELARRRAVEQAQFSRLEDDYCEVAHEPEESVSVSDLVQQARDLARWVQDYREGQRPGRETLGVEKDEVTVADMIDYLWTRLGPTEATLDEAGLIHEQPTASRKANLFLGMLELVRDQQLEIDQRTVWGPAWLCRLARENECSR